jgi:hypothetical protein
MRASPIVVGSIGFQDAAQVVLAQDHDVIQTLPTGIVTLLNEDRKKPACGDPHAAAAHQVSIAAARKLRCVDAEVR